MPVAGCLATTLALAMMQPAAAQDGAPAASPGGGVPSTGDVTLKFSRTGPTKDSFTLSRGVALFPVTIAGREVWGLIDNRSEFSVIDTALAQSAGLEVRAPSGTFPGPTGTVEKRQVLDVPVAIPGQFDMRMPGLAAVDLRALSTLHEREIGFVLGRNLLSMLVVLMDTGQRSIKLMPSGAGSANGGPPPVTLARDSNLVELDLGGGKQPAVLDLALGTGIRMSPALFARLQPDALPTTRSEPTRRLSGTVQIGPMTGRNPPVVVAPVDDGAAEIAIGLPMFRNTMMVIDFGQERLWLLPSAPVRTGPAGEGSGPAPAGGATAD